MATDTDFERIALSLPGTEARPHADRTAYRVRRIYATLAPDGLSANLMYGLSDQKLFARCGQVHSSLCRTSGERRAQRPSFSTRSRRKS